MMSTFSMVRARIIKEPELLFGGSFPAKDPKIGISLYGPYSFTKNSVRIGIVGDKTTVGQVKTILDRLKGLVNGKSTHPLWTPDFPGISSERPFKCQLIFDDKWTQTITDEEIKSLEELARPQERISDAVDIFIKYITNLKELEGQFDVIVCAPPLKMMELCIVDWDTRAKGKARKTKWQRKFKKTLSDYRQQTVFDFIPELKESREKFLIRTSAENFHHLLKARVMDLEIPTQFILPYTLDAYTLQEQKKMQDDATFSWNLCTALLYKSGARLWRPALIPQGTCFVGIAFYREKEVFGGQMGTSLAQIFTPEGEGLVIRGERIPWTKGISPHLKKDPAKRLLEKAISLYEKQTRVKPSRVVIHKSSKFLEDEQEGFKEALKGIPNYDFVSILSKTRRIRFFREGYNPVLRGTMITLHDDSWLLYTRGYVPFMKVYPGPHVPRPLEITQHIGQAQPETISEEVLLLTKINWNSADFSSIEPMTLQFSRQVGRILRELPPGKEPQSKYMYYM